MLDYARLAKKCCVANLPVRLAGNMSEPKSGCASEFASKCRHQRICIIGRGVDLSCVGNCKPDRGGAFIVSLCDAGQRTATTFKFNVTANVTSTIITHTNPSFPCRDFTKLTGHLDNSNGTEASDTVDFSIAPLDRPVISRSPPAPVML